MDLNCFSIAVWVPTSAKTENSALASKAAQFLLFCGLCQHVSKLYAKGHQTNAAAATDVGVGVRSVVWGELFRDIHCSFFSSIKCLNDSQVIDWRGKEMETKREREPKRELHRLSSCSACKRLRIDQQKG